MYIWHQKLHNEESFTIFKRVKNNIAATLLHESFSSKFDAIIAYINSIVYVQSITIHNNDKYSYYLDPDILYIHDITKLMNEPVLNNYTWFSNENILGKADKFITSSQQDKDGALLRFQELTTIFEKNVNSSSSLNNFK